MKDDEEFNVEFVSVIEKHEVLYNYKLEKYSNRNFKEKAWQQVAAEVKCTGEFKILNIIKRIWKIMKYYLLKYCLNIFRIHFN